MDDNSDEEDGPEFNDYSSNEDLSDSEPTMTEHEAVARSRQRKLSRSKARPAISVSREGGRERERGSKEGCEGGRERVAAERGR